MDIQSQFGRNIERLRIDGGFSRAALASRSGMSSRYVARLEKGGGRPTLKTIEAVAEALGVEPRQLLKDIPPIAG